MATKITADTQITGWDEHAYDVRKGEARTTRAKATKTYDGDIEGEASITYLMAYAEDGSATFVGLEHVTGSVAGRKGSFAMTHIGRFEGGVPTAKVEVAPGSGTEELAGLKGKGEFVTTGHDGKTTLSITFA